MRGTDRPHQAVTRITRVKFAHYYKENFTQFHPLIIYIVLPLLKKIWLLGEEIDLQSIVHEENSDVHKNLTRNSNILTNTVKFAHYYKENLTFNHLYCTPTVEENMVTWTI
jgi:hypothetical protein